MTVTDVSTPTHQTASKQFPVTIGPTLAITNSPLPAGIVNVAYSGQLAATGGTSPVTWTSTALPAGLTLNASTGAITGTPGAIGTTSFTVTATDSTSPTHLTASQQFSITIGTGLTITTAALPSGVVGSAYSAPVAASNGTAPLAWSATGLPSPLTINATSGVITGTPASSGTFPVTVTVTDSTTPTNQTASKQFSLVIGPALAITTTLLPNGVVGLAYNAPVVATGGTTPFTFAATGLPSPLAINATSGVITGTPGSSGTFTVNITVTDATLPTNQTASKQLSLTIAPALAITTSALPEGVVNAAYSAPVAASNGTAPLAWSATGLPSPLTINATSGVITGTPASSGTFPVTVTVTDATTPTNQTASKQLSLVIVSGLAFTTTALPNGAVGLAYNTTVVATGGTTPFTWSATGLPSPLAINTTSGAITGTPGSSGTFTVNITVTDSTTPTNLTASKQFSLTIAPVLAITTASLPNGAVGLAYSAPVAASGGNTPLAWSATGLPSPLAINATSGAITGTPGSSGTFTVNITVTDSTTPTNLTASKQLSLTIAPVLAITTASLPNGVVGVAYSAPVAASGGNSPLAWSATGLPSPLVIDPAAGTITGTPGATGTFPVTVTVTDATTPTNQTASKQLSLVIVSGLAFTTTTLPNGAVGLAYSAPVVATGGTTPFTWSATGLPSPLAINTTSGVITGTPGSSGTFTVNITVTDSTTPTNLTASKQFSLTIAPVLAITTASLPNGVVGVAYSAPVAASGGNTPLAWSATGLPSPLAINATSGAITGTPASSGTFTVNITVTDATLPTNQTASKQLSLTIAPALAITTSALPEGVVGVAYSAPVAASGGNSPLAWSATGLPSPLTINSTSGAITGTPGATGTFPVTVTVTDATTPTNQTASKQLSLVIVNGLAFTTTALPNGAVGLAYNTTVVATGGTTPFTWSATGLPSPLAINSTSGVITGTPASSGTFTVNITVTDSTTPTNLTASKQFSLTIAPVLAITTASLPNGVVGVAYSAPVAASGGNTPLAWSATGLPTPLAINATSGAITGTPGSSGTFTVNVTVTDATSPTNQTASKQLSLTIVAALTITTTSPLPNGQAGSAYNTTVAATGGTTPFSWSATGLPSTLAMNPSTGAISGSPTAPGSYTVGVTVTDATTPTNQSATKTLALTILPGTLAITSNSLPGGQLGVAYAFTVVISGGTSPFDWSGTTGLPAGLSINSNGQITGTPTSGSSTVNLKVTDSGSPQQSATKSLSIAIQTLAITTTTLPNATAGTSYSYQLTSSGGTAPLTWSVVAMPRGLSLSTLGLISGTPLNAGTNGLTITVTDSSSPQQSAQAILSLTILPQPLAITTTSLPDGVSGSPYSTQLSATGGLPAYTWAATPLPLGLTVNSYTGVISGTPTAVGTTNVVITVTDASSPPLQASTTIPLTVTLATGGGLITVSSVSVGQNLQVPITITFTPALTTSQSVTIAARAIPRKSWSEARVL